MKNNLKLRLMNARLLTFLPPNISVEGCPALGIKTDKSEGTRVRGCEFLSRQKIEKDHESIYTAIKAGASSIIRMTHSKSLREFANSALENLLEMAFEGWKARDGLVSLEINGVHPLISAALVSKVCLIGDAPRERGLVEDMCHPHGYRVELVRGKANVLLREPVYPRSTGRGDNSPSHYEFLELLKKAS